MAAKWETLEPANTDGEYHVVPIDDGIVHLPEDCVCGVTTEAVQRDDGSYGWLVTHHSLDGREQHE